MARNKEGFCGERSLDRHELDLCDYHKGKKGKRRNLKPRCRNCVHFQIAEIIVEKKIKKNDIAENDV